MQLSFLVPSVKIPVGGILSIYRFAEAQLDFGHDVRIVHIDAFGAPAVDPAELSHLITFDPRLSHEVRPGNVGRLGGGDVVFCFDEMVPDDAGLPVMWVQAVGGLSLETEHHIFSMPCPKLCTSTWLQYVAVELGNPVEQTAHTPYGLDAARFAKVIALEDRPPSVLMLFNPHPIKGSRVGIEALTIAKRRAPQLQATLFGTCDRPAVVPDWVDFVSDPPQDELATLYNNHSAYLLPSGIEGFGITGIEAQACGTPVVTTANGGSADFATAGITGLVSAPGDAEGLAEHIVAILGDSSLAQRISVEAHRRVGDFTWERSGRTIDELLHRYVADPTRFQSPVTLPSDVSAGLQVPELLARFNRSRGVL